MRVYYRHTADHPSYRTRGIRGIIQSVESPHGRRILLIVKYLLAFLPIAWILMRMDFVRFRQALAETEPWVIPSIALLTVLLMFLQGFKWFMLLRAFIPHLSISEVLSCHFKAIYYSMFLPTSAAQDVVRTIMLSRSNDFAIAWGATWLTRISGLIVLLLISLLGLFMIDKTTIPAGIAPAIIMSWLLIIVVTCMSFSKKITRVFNRIVASVAPAGLMNTLERIRDGIYHYRNKRSCLVKVLIITVVIHLLFILNAVLMFRGITGAFHVSECFLYIPLIEVVCLSVPLTPNGIGVRDALSALMFRQIGLPSEQLGTYVLLGLSTVILKVVGGVPLLYEWIIKLKNRSS